MITTIEALRTYIPQVLKNTNWEQYQQHVELALELEVLPVVGQALYTAINVSGVTGVKATVLELTDRVTALYGYFYAMNSQLTASGSLGIHEQASSDGSSQPVRQWVFNQQREQALLQADIWMEKLLSTLDQNKASLPEWESSSEFQLREGLLLHSSLLMHRYIRLAQPLRIFRKLEPSIRTIEEFTLRPLLGADLYDSLLADQHGTPSAAQNVILEKVRRAVSFLSVADALPQLTVIFDGSGIYIPSSADGISTKNAMSDNGFKLRIDDYRSKGAQALADIVTYMEANATSHPLYVPRGSGSLNEPSLGNALSKGSFFV